MCFSIPEHPHNMVSPSKCPPGTMLSSLSVPPYESIPPRLGGEEGTLVGGDLENPPHTSDNPRKNLKDERGQEVHEKFIKVGGERGTSKLYFLIFLVWSKWAISGPKLVHLCNSGSTLIVHELIPIIIK